MRRTLFVPALLLTLVFLGSCRKDHVEKIEPFEFNAPDYFPEIQYNFNENQFYSYIDKAKEDENLIEIKPGVLKLL